MTDTRPDLLAIYQSAAGAASDGVDLAADIRAGLAAVYEAGRTDQSGELVEARQTMAEQRALAESMHADLDRVLTLLRSWRDEPAGMSIRYEQAAAALDEALWSDRP